MINAQYPIPSTQFPVPNSQYPIPSTPSPVTGSQSNLTHDTALIDAALSQSKSPDPQIPSPNLT
jgi:hypothetical protein